jgi:hypothetical protein
VTGVISDVSKEPITSIFLGDKNRLARNVSNVLRLLVTAKNVPSSPILVTLMMEPIRSSEMFVLTRATRRNFPEMVFFLVTAVINKNPT